jgi:hypothetical protein
MRAGLARAASRGGAALLALAGLLAFGAPARPAEPEGILAVISDIHFNPFDAPGLAARLAASEPSEWPSAFASSGRQSFPGRGQDTNHVLLGSALRALAGNAAGADLVVVSGDLLAHRFEEIAGQALGTPPGSEAVRRLASKTAVFVADAVRAALPGIPVLVALGNNDSACGDYALEPGGAFLASLAETVRELAGPDRLAPDFDETFKAGGYYAADHPTAAGVTVVVLNDVLWSADYRDACGGDGTPAAEAMMTWLERQLGEARSRGRHAWLVHHIPVGIDPYATLHDSSADSCPARITPLLKEPFGSRFVHLQTLYADRILAGFAGHTHQDGYRLITSAGTAVGVEKIVPSISPVFGNNPAFQVFDYDSRSGEVRDFSTWYLANLDASAAGQGEWRLEYVFTRSYGEGTYSAEAVQRMSRAMLAGGTEGERTRRTFGRFHPVSYGEIPASQFRAYSCAVENLAPSSYGACHCGG